MTCAEVEKSKKAQKLQLLLLLCFKARLSPDQNSEQNSEMAMVARGCNEIWAGSREDAIQVGEIASVRVRNCKQDLRGAEFELRKAKWDIISSSSASFRSVWNVAITIQTKIEAREHGPLT
ncbi:hypothetical protein DFH11DRAFT_1545583 [Phellopilus nigrolimitatus]|nr:hypothetical protein DFH11DRAFT_1545583 [Phellopilus nigrolimitatus]